MYRWDLTAGSELQVFKMPSFFFQGTIWAGTFHLDFPYFLVTSSLLSLDASRGHTSRTALNPGQAPLLYQAVHGWVPQGIVMTFNNSLPTYLSGRLCTNAVFKSNLRLFVWSFLSAFSCFITSIIPILFLRLFLSHLSHMPFVLHLACTLQIHFI